MNSEKKNKPNIAIVLFPWASKAPYNFVSDIIKLLEHNTNEIFLITSHINRIKGLNKVKAIDIGLSVHYAKDRSPLIFSYIFWIIKSFLIQLSISIQIIKIANKVDEVIYLAYPFYFIPLIISKIFRIKNIELITRSKRTTSNKILKFYFDYNEKLVFWLLDGISPESPSLIQELGLKKYKQKLLTECCRYVEINNKILTINNRKNLVGYIGRLRKEKGIIEFMDSIPLILNERRDVEFLIAGEGDLSIWVEKKVNELRETYNVNINYVGWIPNSKVYDYLNTLKILVMPSYSEGLPTIILEAMANGTLVLSTPIGGIIDVIEEGKNGFFLQSNTSDSIKNEILNILKGSNNDFVSLNAINTINSKYTFDKAVNRYQKIISFEKIDYDK